MSDQQIPVKELVTAAWLKQKIVASGKKIDAIAKETEVGASNISAWANGLRNMSAPVKMMLYLYFKYYVK